MSDFIIINSMNASMNFSMKCHSEVGLFAASNTKINHLKFGFFKEKRANKTEDKNSYESYYKTIENCKSQGKSLN